MFDECSIQYYSPSAFLLMNDKNCNTAHYSYFNAGPHILSFVEVRSEIEVLSSTQTHFTRSTSRFSCWIYFMKNFKLKGKVEWNPCIEWGGGNQEWSRTQVNFTDADADDWRPHK